MIQKVIRYIVTEITNENFWIRHPDQKIIFSDSTQPVIITNLIGDNTNK